MTITQWWEIDCECGNTFWIDNGDPQDVTGFDVDVVKCPWCKSCFTMDGERVEDDECCELGAKKPK